MVELYLNNQLFDLYGNETIATDYAIAPISDIASRSGAKSVTFKAPRTANNLAILENANVIVNDSVLPYRLIPARLEVNGLPQGLEFAQIKSVKDDIELALYGSNVDFFGTIKGRKLADLGDIWNHAWTLQNAYDSRNSTEGYIYGIIDFHSDSPNSYIGITTPEIDVRGLLPSVFLHSIISEIITQAGFTAQGDFLSDADYRRIIIPCLESFPDTITLTDSQDFVAGATLGLNEIIPLMVSINGTVKILEGSTVTIQGITDQNDSIVLRVGADAELTAGVYGYGMLSEIVSQSNLSFYAGTNAGDPASVYFLTVGETYRITTELTFRNENQTGGVNMVIGYLYDTIYPAFTALRTFRFGFDFGSYLQLEGMLPSMKQSDLLKDTAQKFGLIFQVNNATQTVHIRQFSEIIDNITNAIDWSDKVDYSEKPELKFDSGYARINNCKYEDDDSVVKPLGTDSEILIDNENLEAENDLFESPFAASEQVLRFGNDTSIAQIKFFTGLGTAEATQENVEPRYLILRYEEFSVFTYTNGPDTETASSVPVTHFIIPDRDFNAGFDNNLLDNSSEFIAMIQNYKNVELLLRLTPSDINQLDHFTPVWIEIKGQPGCYFYVSRVKQFKHTGNESTIVELGKLQTT